MMHDFKVLLFGDCKNRGAVKHPTLALEMQAIIDTAGTPEAIDDTLESIIQTDCKTGTQL